MPSTECWPHQESTVNHILRLPELSNFIWKRLLLVAVTTASFWYWSWLLGLRLPFGDSIIRGSSALSVVYSYTLEATSRWVIVCMRIGLCSGALVRHGFKKNEWHHQYSDLLLGLVESTMFTLWVATVLTLLVIFSHQVVRSCQTRIKMKSVTTSSSFPHAVVGPKVKILFVQHLRNHSPGSSLGVYSLVLSSWFLASNDNFTLLWHKHG